MTVAVGRAPAGGAAARRRRRPGRVLRGLGWTLLTAGFLLVAFIVYELLGTGFVTARHQESLRQQLARDAQRAAPGRETLPPIPGGAFGVIRIPAIGLDAAVVEGVDPEHLKKGPGHYPDTAAPGDGGNVGIAGHRTTYGRPFWDLDRLEPGDRIFLDTPGGRFIYRVEWSRVVAPGDRQVLAPTRRPALTLTTCEPRFSAARRLIVRAVQVAGPGVGAP